MSSLREAHRKAVGLTPSCLGIIRNRHAEAHFGWRAVPTSRLARTAEAVASHPL